MIHARARAPFLLWLASLDPLNHLYVGQYFLIVSAILSPSLLSLASLAILMDSRGSLVLNSLKDTSAMWNTKAWSVPYWSGPPRLLP